MPPRIQNKLLSAGQIVRSKQKADGLFPVHPPAKRGVLDIYLNELFVWVINWGVGNPVPK